MKTEHLLSPEFIVFSQKIADIYHTKEEKVAAFKVMYLQHKSEIAELEAEALKLKEDFDSKHE